MRSNCQFGQRLPRALFDAMPLPVFIVDKDVTILEHNAAASRLFVDDQRTRKQLRGGDVLKCLHATESPGGCGRSPACSRCGLRGAVNMACQGQAINRQWLEMEVNQPGQPAEVNLRVSLRVSCQPFNYGKSTLVLLVLEGLND